MCTLLAVVFVLSMFPLFTLAQSEEEISQFPAPTGPYSVGTTTRYFVDASRDEPHTIDTDDKRELMIQFWYPAEIGEDVTPAPYIPYSGLLIPSFNTAFSAVTGSSTLCRTSTFPSEQNPACLSYLASSSATAIQMF